MSNRSRSKKRRKNTIKNLLILALVFIILGGIYYYVNIYMHETPPPPAPERQADYIVLENSDSARYKEIVLYNTNVNINTVSKTFYNSNIFWPYIFIANQDVEGVKNNPLDIPKGSRLKIPRLTENMIDPANEKAIERVKHLADSILNAPQ